MASMPTLKGAKLSKEHRRNMSKARRESAAVQAHHERMRTVMKGRHPKEATATKMALGALRKLGLTRSDSPSLFKRYFELYLNRFVNGA